jgi:hypothetical protein
MKILTNTYRRRAHAHTHTHTRKHQHRNTCTRHLQSLDDDVPAAMGLLKQLMIFGKPGLQGLPTRVALPLRDIQLRLSKGATGVPLFTMWDSVAGPGRTPMPEQLPGNNSGRSQPGNSAVSSTVGRLGVDGFWIGDYGGRVRVGHPVGARRRSPVRGSARCP